MNNEIIKSFFTRQEIDKIRNAEIQDRRHPLQRLLFPAERDLWVVANTEMALRHIKEHEKSEWVERIKPRLLDPTDYSEPSSALGEIRAFGSLLEAGIEAAPVVEQNEEAQPDFSVRNMNETARVEVNSKQLHGNESKALAEFNKKPRDDSPECGRAVVSRELIVTPFGKPRCGENVTENAISKLAQIKQRRDGAEPQMSDTETSLLWLDLQDEIWDLAIGPDSGLPVRSSNRGFYSGELWYAFYGWKCAPIFEGQIVEDAPFKPPVRMRHEGRYKQKTNVDAVIVSFPQATIVLENPCSCSKKQIKPWLWSKLTCLPWFNIQLSQANWPSRDLASRVEHTRGMLNALAEVAKNGW